MPRLFHHFTVSAQYVCTLVAVCCCASLHSGQGPQQPKHTWIANGLAKVFAGSMSDDDNCVGRGYFGQQDLMINGWMFCIHGLEWCNRCGMDHRMCNNIQVNFTWCLPGSMNCCCMASLSLPAAAVPR